MTQTMTRRARRLERTRRRATWRFFAGICVLGVIVIVFAVVVTFAG
jgi:hypothetical protein